MNRAVIIKNGVVIGATNTDTLTHPEGLEMIYTDTQEIGDLWDGSVFTTPPPVVVVPAQATGYQIRMALIALGKIADVKTEIDNSVDLEFVEYWSSKELFGRNDAHIATMASALGYGDSQIDTLFINAGEI